VEIAIVLLEMVRRDGKATDPSGNTASTRDSRMSHSEFVGTQINQSNSHLHNQFMSGGTPLAGGAWNGYEEVPRLLLERNDINADKADKYGRTPLWRAACKGHGSILRRLLGRKDVSPNRVNQDGQTVRSYALMHRQEGVVKILLEMNDVSPNKTEKYGHTALSLAVDNGQEGCEDTPGTE